MPEFRRTGLSFLLILRLVRAQSSDDARSLANAVQNINGMSSILALIPVLTGKVQNIKLIAARNFPGALAAAGLGAGRVLTKLQVGMLLFSSDLYRNLVGEFSYHHDEYVNKFSPAVIHVPTGTPERHSSNIIINHNLTELYMVEAWFKTQGAPSQVELSQNCTQRTFIGLLIYIIAYAFETFLGARTSATNTSLVFVVMQIISALFWISSASILQKNRGQGKHYIDLNQLDNPEYRCFQLVTSGRHVQSAVFSIHLSNIREFNLFDSNYDNKILSYVGFFILASGVIDIVATVLLVGLNPWVYGWLAYQVIIVFVKVAFSLEPVRELAIKNIQPKVKPETSFNPHTHEGRLPILINCAPEFKFLDVCIGKNIVLELGTQMRWQSRSPGLYIGQSYYDFTKVDASGILSSPPVRYLALAGGQLTLSVDQPTKESNQALQREFLACLSEITKANKVPSNEFVIAIEATMYGIRQTMDAQWFEFGTKDLKRYLRKCKDMIIWRRVM